MGKNVTLDKDLLLQIRNIAEVEGADVDTTLKKADQSHIDTRPKPSLEDIKEDVENLFIMQDANVSGFITEEEVFDLLKKAQTQEVF